MRRRWASRSLPCPSNQATLSSISSSMVPIARFMRSSPAT